MGEMSKRPTRYDDAVVRPAAAVIAKACSEWAGDGDPDDWIDDLIQCRHEWDDPYRLAKRLDDRYGVSADFELVETLDGVLWEVGRIHDDAVKAWVAETGFTPAYAVGDVVTCAQGTGPIHEIRMDTAQYVVATTDRDWGLGGGYIINAEDLQPPEKAAA